VFDLATRNSDKQAEKPLKHRAPRLTAQPCHTVGRARTRKVPASSRYERRRERDRYVQFRDAVTFAYAVDYPLTIHLTITWTALMTAGERNEGHCLGRDDGTRETYLRNELARLCRSEGLPFVSIWGRDVGARMGSHVHLSMFWPSYNLAKLKQLVAVIERVSGSHAAFVLKPYTDDVVARSICGGWQVNMNNREDSKASALNLADYIAGQHAKHPTAPEIMGKAFGISHAIGKRAQEKARPMLEARTAKYASMKHIAAGDH